MIHLGIITTAKASKLGLWRLTKWEAPEHVFDVVYEGKHSRILVPFHWEPYCQGEAVRIGSDPRRQAAVVKYKQKLAVYVNLVAGERYVKDDDDEEEE